MLKLFLILFHCLIVSILLASCHHPATNKNKPTESPPPPPILQPIKTHSTALLSEYSVSELSMVGYLLNPKQAWAFITTPDDRILKIQLNDELGQEGMKVTHIDDSRVTLKQQDNTFVLLLQHLQDKV